MKFTEKEFKRLQNWLYQNNYGHRIHDDEIICPICQKSKSVDAFTEEHIEPDSIGGKVKTITCKECNSQCGHKLDYTITNFIKHQQLILAGPNFKSQVIVDNISLNAIIENINGSPCITIMKKNNNPKIWTKVRNNLDLSKKFRLNTSSKWSLPKLSRALIKIGHLMSVPGEEYRYILNECGIKLSDVILGKYNGDISKFIHIVSSFYTESKFPKGYCTVTLDETDLRFCFIKLKREVYKDHIYFMVILPGDNCSWTEFIACAEKISELSKEYSMTVMFNKDVI